MTAYHNGTTGETYYAKPLPIVASPWDGDDVALTETGTTGWFSFTNDATKAYAVYQQAGESPDATDEAVAQVDADPSVAILTAIDAIEGGGGGAGADEIVDELLDRGITAIPVQSGVTSAGNLDLVQGDTYNGTAKPLLSFPTSTDYTSGWTATLTIRDVDDEVIATASGVVASATQVTVSLTTPTGLTFDGCPGIWQGKFDVQMSKDTQRATIAHGTAYVREDQTRT